MRISLKNAYLPYDSGNRGRLRSEPCLNEFHEMELRVSCRVSEPLTLAIPVSSGDDLDDLNEEIQQWVNEGGRQFYENSSRIVD